MNRLKTRSKRKELEQTIKEWIISGKLSSGERLPTYEVLNRDFNASRATFHHVINGLKHDGFVKSIERQGVFVSEHPPHLNRFALLFESHEQDNLFWSKLAEQARFMSENTDIEFVIFRGNSEGTDAPDSWTALHKQLEKQMLGGICLTFNPENPALAQTLDQFATVPKVMFEYFGNYENCCYARMDIRSCVQLSLNWLKEQQVRQVAMLTMDRQPAEKFFSDEVTGCGLETKAEWTLTASRQHITSTSNLVKLLMSLPRGDRPEGLYIADDNLLPYVQSALIDKGLKVPEDLKLVCHANFPDKSVTVLPVKKIGIDTKAMIEAMITLIRTFHTTGTCEELEIFAVNEDDISM